MKNNINIKNKKAKFEYEILDTYTAGIKLAGTEIKSIREGKASIAESFCEFSNHELFVINMTVQEYSHATYFNHDPKHARKLLLNRRELRKLEKKAKKQERERCIELAKDWFTRAPKYRTKKRLVEDLKHDEPHYKRRNKKHE